MELTGTQTIRLDQAAVWTALNDPAILRQCIPGCESFECAGGDTYQMLISAAVGPVKARFKGKLSLTDVRAPLSYWMTFEGSGGAAGSAKGTARVLLQPQASGTELSYTAQAQVGGRLAQVGSRLIDGVAGKLAGEFFARFKAAVEPPEVIAQEARPPSTAPSAGASRKEYRWIIGIGLAVIILLIGFLIYR